MRNSNSFSDGSTFSFTNTSQTVKAVAALIFLVMLVAVVVGYPMWNTARALNTSRAAEKAAGMANGSAVLIPSNVMRKQDPNRASWRAMLNPRPVDLQQASPGARDGASAVRSDTMREIQKQTIDDGSVRRVSIDGLPVPPEIVEETIFNNANYATHYDFEFPQYATKLSHDKTRERPTMMFGPLKAPLPNNYGMDIGGKIIS